MQKTIKTRSGRTLILPSAEEEAEINAGIAADPDTFELSEADFKKLHRLGRPRLDNPKVQLTIRYDQDVVDAFKSAGPGWQTRMNDALREWLRDHEIA